MIYYQCFNYKTMRISIKKILVLTLMNVLTSGVNAQTMTSRTKKSDVAQIEQRDSVRISQALAKAKLDEDDSDMVKTLLRNHNKPLEGGIAEDDVIVDGSRDGDDWRCYISNQNGGTFYLTYVVTRDDGKKFVGRVDIRLN